MRASNEQCLWFGKHVCVFDVLLSVQFLNVSGLCLGVFGGCSGLFCRVCSTHMLCRVRYSDMVMIYRDDSLWIINDVSSWHIVMIHHDDISSRYIMMISHYDISSWYSRMIYQDDLGGGYIMMIYNAAWYIIISTWYMPLRGQHWACVRIVFVFVFGCGNVCVCVCVRATVCFVCTFVRVWATVFVASPVYKCTSQLVAVVSPFANL